MRHLGQGCHQRNPNPGLFSTYSLHRLHLRRLQRRARLRRRGFCAAAILLYIDAFDSKRSNSRRSVRLLNYHGCRGRVDISDRSQRWHGHRVYASHRNPLTFNELRRIFGVVYLSRAGRCDERSHAPVRKLRRVRRQKVFEYATSALTASSRRRSIGSALVTSAGCGAARNRFEVITPARS